MSASAAPANIQARNVDGKLSRIVYGGYKKSLNRVAKSTDKLMKARGILPQDDMGQRDEPFGGGSSEEKTADYNRSAYESYERAAIRQVDSLTFLVRPLCNVVANRHE